MSAPELPGPGKRRSKKGCLTCASPCPLPKWPRRELTPLPLLLLLLPTSPASRTQAAPAGRSATRRTTTRRAHVSAVSRARGLAPGQTRPRAARPSGPARARPRARRASEAAQQQQGPVRSPRATQPHQQALRQLPATPTSRRPSPRPRRRPRPPRTIRRRRQASPQSAHHHHTTSRCQHQRPRPPPSPLLPSGLLLRSTLALPRHLCPPLTPRRSPPSILPATQTARTPFRRSTSPPSRPSPTCRTA